MMRRVAALAAAALLLAACGGDGGGDRFGDHVAAVRDAVASGDREAALAALDDIALVGLDAHAQGELTDAEIDELAGLVEQGRALVADELPEPTTTTTTTTTTVAEDEDDEDEKDDDKDDDKDDEKDDDEDGGGGGKGRGNTKKGDD